MPSYVSNASQKCEALSNLNQVLKINTKLVKNTELEWAEWKPNDKIQRKMNEKYCNQNNDQSSKLKHPLDL